MGLFGPPNVEKLKAKKDVDGLLEALAHRDESVRRSAAEALGDVGDSRTLDPLTAALQDPATPVAAAAAEALGKIDGDVVAYRLALASSNIRVPALQALASMARRGNAAAVEVLVRKLQSHPATAAFASSALSEIGEPAIGPVVAAVADRKIDATVAAALLGRLGGAGVQALVGALRGDGWWERVSVIDTLREIGDPAVEPLIAALKDETSGIQKSAAKALGELADHRAIEPLVGALADAELRGAALDALGDIGDSRAVDAVVHALNDESWGIRKAAAEALGTIGDPRAVESLVNTLKDAEEYVRQAAAEALEQLGWTPQDDVQRAWLLVSRGEWAAAGELGAAAVEPLMIALGSRTLEARKLAARSLGQIGGPRATEALVAVLNDMDVRDAANQALTTMGWQPTDNAQRARQLVIELEDASYGQRDGIARQLVDIGSAAVEDLVAALQSKNQQVRETAAQALGTIGDPRAVEPLMLLAADEKRAIQKGASLLATLVERTAAQVSEETLRKLNSTRFWEWGVTWEPPEDMDPRCELTPDWGVISADSSRVVQLARQELIRRAMQA